MERVAITRMMGVKELRRMARKEKSGRVAARMLAIANVLSGMSRGMAAQLAGMERQTLRDWVHRFNAEGRAGLRDRPRSGRSWELGEADRHTRCVIVETGPDPERDGLARWRRIDLKTWLKNECGVAYHERSVGQRRKRLGYRHMSVRPAHPQGDPDARKDCKENFAAQVAAVLPARAKGHAIERWFQDEARVGQNGTLTRIWARRGSRPRLTRDQRYAWADIVGAGCPARDAGVALVMPDANIPAMNRQLEEISRPVVRDAPAVIIIDGAGWHKPGGKLVVPDNITLLHLPPYSPELNAQEHVWEYLRHNYLAGRLFDTYDDIVDACCTAWNAFAAAKDQSQSIASRDWRCLG